MRELQGYLLLSIVAAAHGHQTVIASPNDIWLYVRLGLLPKGAYLIKNVNIPSSSAEIYKKFLKAGFDLYCHEQEPSILWGNFENFLHAHNITRDQILPFKAIFCWGKRDTLGYQNLFKSKGNLFVNTGSPRADLWNTRFFSVHQRNLSGKKPYMLVVSNFGLWMGKRPWCEWMAAAKRMEILQKKDHEDNYLDFIIEDSAIALHVIKVVRYLAARYPDYRIVVRPHPLDHPPHWNTVVGDNSNIEVIDISKPLTDWIQDASLVIQNGCTSALQAVLMKVPLINVGPERHKGDLKIPSSLGLKAETFDGLDEAIQTCLDKRLYAPIQMASEFLLKDIVSTNGGDAASQMIRVMQDRSTFDPAVRIRTLDVWKLRIMRHLKNSVDRLRSSINLLVPQTGTENMDRDSIISDVESMAHELSIAMPDLVFIKNSGVIVRPSVQAQP